MVKEYNLKQFLGGKYDLFSRGSFQIFTFLILFSPAFTSMYKEKVLLFSIFVLLITINNLGVEYFSITKNGSNPKDYIGLFMSICLPVNILILVVFYIL
jgi:hypothetical protein